MTVCLKQIVSKTAVSIDTAGHKVRVSQRR
ncbi:hypothetical protein GobsT_58110 [Gemmata obscuriglobus]|nr:hypothetical protein GobsT_58110 [Gemmata obscuriglobus]VTS10326.1 unnamed protein product [Gemmata obscuriglobus UQM 2246]